MCLLFFCLLASFPLLKEEVLLVHVLPWLFPIFSLLVIFLVDAHSVRISGFLLEKTIPSFSGLRHPPSH